MSTGIAGIDAVTNSKYDVELDDKKKELDEGASLNGAF